MPTGNSYRVPSYVSNINLPSVGRREARNGVFTPTTDAEEADLLNAGAVPLTRIPVLDTVNRNLRMSDYASTINSASVTYGIPPDLGVGFTTTIVGHATLAAAAVGGVTPTVNDYRSTGATNEIATVVCKTWNVYDIYGAKA